MISAKHPDGHTLSTRASQAGAGSMYPPEGDRLIRIQFVRWEHFTSKDRSAWDDVFLSESDAEILYADLKRELRR